MLNFALAAGAVLLTGWAALRSLRMGTRLHAVDESLQCASVQGRELQRIQTQIERLTAIQRTSEAVVDGGAAVVRAVHKGIAEIPFSILESIPATRDTTKMVRGIHDLTSDVVYGSISVINKAVGGTLRAGIKSGAVVEKKPGDKKDEGEA